MPQINHSWLVSFTSLQPQLFRKQKCTVMDRVPTWGVYLIWLVTAGKKKVYLWKGKRHGNRMTSLEFALPPRGDWLGPRNWLDPDWNVHSFNNIKWSCWLWPAQIASAVDVDHLFRSHCPSLFLHKPFLIIIVRACPKTDSQVSSSRMNL